MLLKLLHTLIFLLEISALINGKYWKTFSIPTISELNRVKRWEQQLMMLELAQEFLR